jgi:hypothetical protein
VAAELHDDGSTRLLLEDLSSLRRGADPVAIARSLRRLHEEFAGSGPFEVVERWPWLRRVGCAADLIGSLYDSVWATSLSSREDLPPSVRELGASLVGHVEAAEWGEGSAGPLTLCHGDPSVRNVFTDADGEVVFVDWEDVRCASGIVDLGWLLVSSVEPGAWSSVIEAYGLPRGVATSRLAMVLPSVSAQGFLALSDASPADAGAWIDRLGAAAEMLDDAAR